ncbi:MAG: ATPase, T2SS/T4P/T4SS family [Microbacterium sp.]|uniref:CpaF family protein n=1 Tax=Microbacterium sp. TaxID=51671 RepID=UPI002624EE38|nr:ATPase, T2SS/T4P/T4SS family [Microbacterium sp.]MCX6502737.1 ATPase, T2SS/T4P/T4SS family [Microbacterium sp.]
MTELFVARPRGETVRGGARQPHPAWGPLAALIADPDVTDVFVNGAAGAFADRGNGALPVADWQADERFVRDLAVTLIALGGRHLDDGTPCVDVRVGIPRAIDVDLEGLQRRGMFDEAGRARLERLIRDRTNVLLTGAGGSGKTTLLAALLARADATDRIVTIEDVAELRIDHPHHVRLEARQPNLEGAGGIGMARLVREALRMRPDRLVVGECRGDEVRELLSALNTGHDGGAGTLHANSLDDVPARLEALGALAGLDDRALARQVASAIGAVVHLARTHDGTRHVAGIGRPRIVDDRLTIEEER